MPSCCLHPLPYRADATEYFAAVHQAPGAVLLDSARPGSGRGRFDLLSAWPEQLYSAMPGEQGAVFLQRLRQGLKELGDAQLPEGSELPFAGGLIGYLSYDFGRRLEQFSSPNLDDLKLAHTHLGLYAWALVSDHQACTSQLVFHPSLAESRRNALIAIFEGAPPTASATWKLTQPMRSEVDASAYRQAFDRIQAYIAAGDCYQVNLTRRFSGRCEGDPWVAYKALRAACPTPFSGFLRLGDEAAILSHSPERFMEVHRRRVETRPIKGTRPRGATAQADAALAAELLASPKDRSENLMIVDLLRNDLGRACRIGSVKVPELFALESYPNVHHMVSSVTGELAAGKDPLDLIASSFPGGSITGAPKIRAMQIIDEVEPTQRAIYCGALLYLDVRGEMDSSIAIRTLLVREGQVACWGGGAVVGDSQWEAEFEESFIKVQVLLETLAGV